MTVQDSQPKDKSQEQESGQIWVAGCGGYNNWMVFQKITVAASSKAFQTVIGSSSSKKWREEQLSPASQNLAAAPIPSQQRTIRKNKHKTIGQIEMVG